MSLDWLFVLIGVFVVISSHCISILIAFPSKKRLIMLIIYLFSFGFTVFIGSPLFVKDSSINYIYSSSTALLIAFFIILLFTILLFLDLRAKKKFDLFILLFPISYFLLIIPYCYKLGLIGEFNNTKLVFENWQYIFLVLVSYIMAKLIKKEKGKQFFTVVFLLALDMFVYFVFQSSTISFLSFLYPFLYIGCFILFFISLIIIIKKGINFVV